MSSKYLKKSSSGFAKGGIMSAASGKMFTTLGPQMVVAGDNPGGKETVAFIPHNRKSFQLRATNRYK